MCGRNVVGITNVRRRAQQLAIPHVRTVVLVVVCFHGGLRGAPSRMSRPVRQQQQRSAHALLSNVYMDV